MARIRLYSHAPSETVNRLKDALVAAGHNAKKLRAVGGTYRGREGDIVLNYGSSQLPAATIGQAFCLNSPADITRASNKRDSFAIMDQAGVRTVEHTTNRQEAEQWVREGAIVYARTRLQGHSGEGIILVHQNPTSVGDAGGFNVVSSVPSSPLYTKGVLGNRREYRVHIFRGKIIHIAQKRRRDGFNEIPDHSNLVRNHHTGWVYSTQNMTTLNTAGKRNALLAMEAVGLDYGAVDVITNRDDAWILEINTAPGMEGVTLEKYVQAIGEYANGDEITGETVDTTPATQTQENTRASHQPGGELEAMQQHQQQAQRQEPSRMQQNEARVAAAQSQPSVSAIPPAPTGRANASVSEQSNAAQTRRNRNAASLNDGDCYWIVVAGEQTIGKYNSSVDSFEILGWEVPVERSEATVEAHIENPRNT